MNRAMGLLVAAMLAVGWTVAGCSASGSSGQGADGGGSPSTGRSDAGSPSTGASSGGAPAGTTTGSRITSWVYQLQNYQDGRLDALARAPQQLAVIDLARDAGTGYFRPDEIAALRRSGKMVLAYFEIGSIEEFRPEYPGLRSRSADLILNRWNDWPDEHFVRYWDERWWAQVIRPRVDQALAAGFDGVYLDTPLAYEELDLALVPGTDRDTLARRMVDLIRRISSYAKARRPQFWIVPQNSPELHRIAGYLPAIDGIGMEELFFQATDQPCDQDYCAENLADARAVRDAGKLVLAVDYASKASNIATACAAYKAERFAGYVGGRSLDRVGPPCP
jgi:cysteinyl-tRNA synthetase